MAMEPAGPDLALETADAVVVRDELTGLVLWDLLGHLPLPLGVAGHEGSTVLVGLNGPRLLKESALLKQSAWVRHTRG